MTDDAKQIKDILEEHGAYFTRPQGRSMLPAIREKSDLIRIEPLESDRKLAPGDVLLYPGAGGKLTLHRLYKLDGDFLVINGDNCDFFERLPRSAMLGRLTGLYRYDKELSLDSFGHRLYLMFWYRPWWCRFAIKKVYRHLKLMLRKKK